MYNVTIFALVHCKKGMCVTLLCKRITVHFLQTNLIESLGSARYSHA